MSQSVSSSSNKILLDKFLKAVQQKAKNSDDYDKTHTLNPDLLSDIKNFPQLLNDIIVELKSNKTHVSHARIIAATACEILQFYTLNRVYQKGEEENLKQVIKLLGFLIVGAIKTPLIQAQPSQQSEPTSQNSSSDNLMSEDRLENSPSCSFITTQSLPKPNEQSVISDLENEEKYSVIALKIVNQMLLKKNLELATLLRISSFYCVNWNHIQSNQETKSQSFVRLQKVLLSLDFDDNQPTYKKAVKIVDKLGLREVIGLAEFQYRKQNYIKLKSKLTDSNNSLESLEHFSPLELLKNHLLNGYQKLKDATSSMVFLENSKLDFDSQEVMYWDYPKAQWGTSEKCLMVFRALVNVCCDGMYRNYRVKCNIANSVGARGKSQERFLEIHNQWIHDLSYITRLSTSARTISNSQVNQFKKSILDWPLSSFFLANGSEPSKIAQTVLKDKVENLALSDAANLLILLYGNIKEYAKPLGQVQSLYAILTDCLSFNKKRLEWSKTYLKQHGLSSIEIASILESQEDIEHR
ncbi:MAG: hypothetical protein QNJ33_07625 [Crocosphaera sp.]|nr:hypothetical protein [Crocosphaera sp.]